MRFVFLASMLTVSALLSGCSSQYIVATNDGRLIETHSKPRLDSKTDMYTFEDSEGRDQSVPKGDVKQIMER